MVLVVGYRTTNKAKIYYFQPLNLAKSKFHQSRLHFKANLKNLLKDEKAQGKEIFDPPKLDGQGIGEKRQSTIPKNGPIVSGPSPSLRFDSASPVGTILSPSTRVSYAAAIVKGKGNPPAQKRKIADGLGDLERYSERKKKQTITNKKRAVSSYVARA